MDLDLSDEQRDLECATRDVLDSERTVELARSLVEQREGAEKEVEDLWSRMVALDWPALTVPEAYGGLGLGPVELAVVTEQLGRALTPGPFLSTSSQFVTAVREAGSEEQRALFLEPVAREGAAGTLAFAEAGGGFDLAGVSTTFRPVGPEGSGFVLEGTKSFVMEASRSVRMVVVARAEGSSGDSGIGLFVVPTDAEGLRINPMTALDSSRELATIELDSVRVGPQAALGETGEAGESAGVLGRILEEATTALAAEMVGTCQGIFDILIEHVSTREQFGVKIGSFQAMKHKLANMYVALEATRATARFAAASLAESDPRSNLAASMAKSAAGDCERLIGVEGIQCLGGIGYTWEHDMHLYVKRVRTAAALFGTAAQHRENVAGKIGLTGER
jgi:alkylation response protein AidB-like acyl-CoA dehydrogenase